MVSLLSNRAVVRLGGEERRAFLQRLVSNDMMPVAEDRAVYAALLTPQGKFLHEMCVIAHDDALLLDTERDRAAELIERLNRAKLRAKVTVEIAEGWRVGAALHATENATRIATGAVTFPDPRLAALGHRILIPPDTDTPPDDGFDAYDRHRLALGVPDGSRDLIVGSSTLLEGLFDRLNGISWTKGCYVGQELTARMRYRGLLKKHLFPVRAASGDTLPVHGAILMDTSGVEVGDMRSSCGNLGLACLDRAMTDGSMVMGGDTTLTVTRPAWMSEE